MKTRVFSLILRLTVSGLLIGYYLHILSRRYDGLDNAFSRIAGAFSGTVPAWLIPAALLHILGFSLISLRWQKLLKAQGISAGFAQLFSLYFMAAFFNLILPSTIGGDAVRAIKSRRIAGTGSSALMIIVVERLTGLVALLMIAWMALGYQLVSRGAVDWLLPVILVILLAVIVLVMVMGHPRISPLLIGIADRFLPAPITARIRDAGRTLEVYYRKPGSLVSALAISVLFQLNMVLYYYMLARALHQTPSIVDFMIKVPIMIVLLMTVPSINGLGVRTFSFGQLMGFPVLIAIAVEAIDLTFRIAYGLIGGLLFLVARPRRRKPVEGEAEADTSALGFEDKPR